MTFGFPAWFFLVQAKRPVLAQAVSQLERVALWGMLVLALYLFFVGLWANIDKLAHSWSKIGAPFTC